MAGSTLSDTAFVDASSVEWTSIGPGIERQILSHGPDLMLVRIRFESGAIGSVHHHPHRQATYVAAGRFEVSVGDSTQVLREGDTFFAAAEVPHGVKALERGMLIDCFTPARTDFLAARG